jgi:hypothetical protein
MTRALSLMVGGTLLLLASWAIRRRLEAVDEMPKITRRLQPRLSTADWKARNRRGATGMMYFAATAIAVGLVLLAAELVS